MSRQAVRRLRMMTFAPRSAVGPVIDGAFSAEHRELYDRSGTGFQLRVDVELGIGHLSCQTNGRYSFSASNM